MFEASESEVIDTDAILKLYDKKKITREAMLSMMSISIAEARKSLGGDMVADLSKTKVGDKVDIRIASLPVENANDEFIMVNKKIRTKNPRLGAALNKPQQTDEVAPKRRIKIRGRK